MITIIRAVFSVINALLRMLADSIVAGGAILIALLGVVALVSVVLGVSGLGALRFLRKNRK